MLRYFRPLIVQRGDPGKQWPDELFPERLSERGRADAALPRSSSRQPSVHFTTLSPNNPVYILM
jgi:hypothetical protein